MKKIAVLMNTALTLVISSYVTLPSLAQTRVSIELPETQGSIVPQSTALMVVFPANMTINLDERQDYPVTLFLAEPIFDSDGNMIAPAKSLVSAYLKRSQDGVQIIADSIIIEGRTLPLQAVSSIIPGMTVAQTRGSDTAKEYGSIGRTIGTTVGGMTGDLEVQERVTFGTSLLGVIAGLSSSPKKVRVVSIAGGSFHILRLQSSIMLERL